MSIQRFQKSGKKGFTLIELLIVFVIMSLLTGLGIGAFMTSRLRARDAKRKTDIENIARALDLYYSDYGAYPTDSFGGSDTGLILGVINWGTEFSFDDEMYMALLPQDPGPTQYYYVAGPLGSAGPISYGLYAALENDEDEGTGVTAPGDFYDGPECVDGDTTSCNYGISSSNVTPGDLSP